jgi:hypothetical protein
MKKKGWWVSLPQQEQHVMEPLQEEQPEEETMAAPAAAQKAARVPYVQGERWATRKWPLWMFCRRQF